MSTKLFTVFAIQVLTTAVFQIFHDNTHSVAAIGADSSLFMEA